MEIAIVQKTALRLKGKNATFLVNPVEDAPVNAALMLHDTQPKVSSEEMVNISGPGEYEIGGVKISGVRSENGYVYSLTVDGVDLVVGQIETLAAVQNKLKDHNIVIALCNKQANAAFLTSAAQNAVIVYGPAAAETAQGFEKEKLQQMNKYSAVAGKLPTELEIVLLA